MEQPFQLNFLNYFICLTFHMALGAFWYSKWGFGKRFAQENPVVESERQTDWVRVGVIFGFSSFLLVYVFSLFFEFLGVRGAGEGLITGLWVWIGFVVTTQLPQTAFENRPIELFIIHAGYYGVSFLGMGIWIGLRAGSIQ
jgi:Na+/proline symporter